VLIGRLVALVTIIIATIILGTFYELIGLALAFLLTSILQAAVSVYANYRLKISP